jgi:cyclase
MTWSRRDFLTTSLLGLAAGSLPRSLARIARDPDPFVELRRNVGIFSSRGGTIGWLANAAGTVVVDTQFPDSAAVCLAGLHARNARPVDAVINTHHHGDHTAGNGVFRESARQIVAHENVPVLQRRAAEASGSEEAQVYADVTFPVDWSVTIGSETVRAKHYGPAHTGGDCTVFFERADVVHMGDLVFNRAYPFIDRAGGASVQGWIDVLEAVAGEHAAGTTFVFGHARAGAEVTGSRDDVMVQRDLLSAVLETARRALAAGRSREEATAIEVLPGFTDFAALSPRLSLGTSVGVAYDELSEAR